MDKYGNVPDGRLLKIHPPADVQDDTSVDIIAIHGLGTTTPHTWEYETATGVVNWLSDSNMLPDIVPSARICTFSWNARYSEDASVARIEDVAGVLLSNLQNQRDKDIAHSRPLIFVASCFGGLIVTKALEIANINDSQYRKLLTATSGVVFLGSPLQGTKAGKAAQWRAMLAGILNKAPSQTLLEDLDGSTRALRRTSENFVTMMKNPPMQTMMTICFWESQKTQLLKAVLPSWTLSPLSSLQTILVEEESACLFGHPKQMLDAPHVMMNKFFGPSDANFGLVSNAIKTMVEQAKTIAFSQQQECHLHNEHFMVSRRPNPLFTGREDKLKKLKQALCPALSTINHTAVPKIYVINGMGGAGKSEIAIKFAHENRSEFWGIFWIDSRSKSSITKGFAAAARMCGRQDESLEDNADDMDLDLAQFFPAGINGSILITTRLTECTKHQTVGKDHYERLDQGTAISLLLKACEIEPSLRTDREENARTVVELLGCHALAIIQAGAAVSQNLCSLEEYEQAFLDQRKELFEYHPGQAKSEYGGVYATFEVSATYLKTRDDQIANDALQLLNFYAFMHFSDFPEVAFEEAWKNSKDETVVRSSRVSDGEESIEELSPWHVSHLPTFLCENPRTLSLDKMRLRKATSLLVSLSLVMFDSDRKTMRMHPVSHFWSRDRLREPRDSTNARLIGLSILSLSIQDFYDGDPSQLSRELQPHIESFANSLNDRGYPKCEFPVQQSMFRLSWSMYRLGYESALFELLQMIPIQTEGTWIRSQNGLLIQHLHGIYWRRFGDASKAVTLLEQLNEVWGQTLTADEPNVLRIQHSLALAYLEIEETTKAIALLEEITKIRSRLLNPDNQDLLTSQHELARAYLKIEETEKAIVLFQTVIETRARTLRPEHPERLVSQHELARAYLRNRETTKALSLLEEVVKMKAKTLRPEHQERLVSQHELALAYLENKETTKAIALLEEVVEIKARTLKLEHRDRVVSILVLARCYYYAKRYERALELARSIENVARNRPGDELADWNAELIDDILYDMGSEMEGEGDSEGERERERENESENESEIEWETASEMESETERDRESP